LYIAGYSLGRIGEEVLRVDPAHHVFGLRLNFYVACALFAGSLAWLTYTHRARLKLPSRRGSALLLAGE
jgi:prolipoprotein diacylglyceryltransferase